MLKKLYRWWTQKSKTDLLLEAIADARLFEEWEAAAFKLDECLDYDMWYARCSLTSFLPPFFNFN